MPEGYNHTELAKRAERVATLPYLVPTIDGPAENVISVMPGTSKEGISCWCLCIDLILFDGPCLLSGLLAYYPFTDGLKALEDGLHLAYTCNLPCRAATSTTGWNRLREHDQDDPGVVPPGWNFEV